MCLHVYFFEFIFFGIYSASWICRSMSFAEFGKYSTIISLSTSSGPLLFLPPSGTPRAWMVDLVIVLQLPQALFFIFSSSLFSLCCLYWTIASALYFTSLILPLSPPLWCWVHSLRFLFCLLDFSVLKSPFGSLYLLFCSWDFLLINLCQAYL